MKEAGMKVVLAGAPGFIGPPLIRALQSGGHEIVALTRRPAAAPDVLPPGARAVGWNGRAVDDAWAGELSGAGAVVNLSGANIGGSRWTAARKTELVESRTQPTAALVDAIGACPSESRPRVLVNASGIDYYGDRGDEVVTEASGPGKS